MRQTIEVECLNASTILKHLMPLTNCWSPSKLYAANRNKAMLFKNNVRHQFSLCRPFAHIKCAHARALFTITCKLKHKSGALAQRLPAFTVRQSAVEKVEGYGRAGALAPYHFCGIVNASCYMRVFGPGGVRVCDLSSAQR